MSMWIDSRYTSGYSRTATTCKSFLQHKQEMLFPKTHGSYFLIRQESYCISRSKIWKRSFTIGRILYRQPFHKDQIGAHRTTPVVWVCQRSKEVIYGKSILSWSFWAGLLMRIKQWAYGDYKRERWIYEAMDRMEPPIGVDRSLLVICDEIRYHSYELQFITTVHVHTCLGWGWDARLHSLATFLSSPKRNVMTFHCEHLNG